MIQYCIVLKGDWSFVLLFIFLIVCTDVGTCGTFLIFLHKHSCPQTRFFSPIIHHILTTSLPQCFGAIYQPHSKFCIVCPLSAIISQILLVSETIPYSSLTFWLISLSMIPLSSIPDEVK